MTAGMSFELFRSLHLLPHRRAAWPLLRERLLHIGGQAQCPVRGNLESADDFRRRGWSDVHNRICGDEKGGPMTTLVVGTEKGAWLLTSDDRSSWEVGGSFFPGWGVTAFGRAADGTYLAGTASGWFGPGLHRSADLQTWEQVPDGPGFGDTGPTLQQIWTFTTAPDGRVYCGVAEAGVFVSGDHGQTWDPVAPFNGHETRHAWQPGAGGMCAHRVLLDGDRQWIAASAIGVFRSDDAGATFHPRNEGVAGAVPDGPPGIGYCVHALVADPDNPDLIWRQDHMGVYRTTDGGDSWESIETGLPAGFGFPIARDHASGALFVAPLESSENRVPVGGRFAAWRSTDGGDSWHESGRGWPSEPTFTSVLRGAMATDGDGGVYLGTTSGEVWASPDAGDTWQRLPGRYPRVAALAIL